MKRVVDVLKYLCSIGAAIVIYITVLRAAEGKENVLMYVVASVCSASLAVSLFALSSLAGRLASVERRLVFLSDDGAYEQDDSPKRECEYCHAYIDEEEEVCPYCRNEGSPARVGEFFETEDPEYRGTDFSGEEYVSAHAQNDDGSEQ